MLFGMIHKHENAAIFLSSCFIFGIFFRLWFIALAPQPVIFDQYEYLLYAEKIFKDPLLLASHSYRSYPFPLVMAILFKFTGFGNTYAVYVLNAVLDSFIGIMIFFLLWKGFGSLKSAWIGVILYMVNPFTSGYVGVVLSEILTAFFITATMVAGLLFVQRPSTWKGLLFGICAGLAAETRNAAFLWAGIPIVLACVRISVRKHWSLYAGIITGLALSVLYPLYTNWRDYKELSITKVDSFYAMEFFNGASLKVLPPFTYAYPREQQEMWAEYWSEYHPGRTRQVRKAIATKYWQKGLAIVKRDPLDYIRWRFFKMWYVWQKENVFFYEEPGYARHKYVTYSFNLMLLALGVLGLVVSFRKKNDMLHTWMWASIFGSIAYTLIAFSFSHAEYRLTIPYYPLLYLSVSLALAKLLRYISS